MNFLHYIKKNNNEIIKMDLNVVTHILQLIMTPLFFSTSLLKIGLKLMLIKIMDFRVQEYHLFGSLKFLLDFHS